MLVLCKRNTNNHIINIDDGFGSYHSSLGGNIRSSPKRTDTARNQHHQNHLVVVNYEENYTGFNESRREI